MSFSDRWRFWKVHLLKYHFYQQKVHRKPKQLQIKRERTRRCFCLDRFSPHLRPYWWWWLVTSRLSIISFIRRFYMIHQYRTDISDYCDFSFSKKFISVVLVKGNFHHASEWTLLQNESLFFHQVKCALRFFQPIQFESKMDIPRYFEFDFDQQQQQLNV